MVLRMRLEFKPQDCWVGVFWRTYRDARGTYAGDIWLCVLPLLPLHISWDRIYPSPFPPSGRK